MISSFENHQNFVDNIYVKKSRYILPGDCVPPREEVEVELGEETRNLGEKFLKLYAIRVILGVIFAIIGLLFAIIALMKFLKMP